MKVKNWFKLANALMLASLSTQISLAQSITVSQPTNSSTPHRSINLDLSSSVATIAAPKQTATSTVIIHTGNTTQTVTAGQLLTPAQMVAVMQILHNGAQSLILNANGTAAGGSMNINSYVAQNLSSLTIPSGVTVYDKASILNVTGNLTNAGTLLAIAQTPTILTSTITAANIFNQPGAIINAIQSTSAGLNLNLIATNNIVNAGTINSSGQISLSAGGSITNALSAASTAGAVIQAVGNLNLNSANIINAGILASTNGNVNIATQLVQTVMQNITIDSRNGSIHALLGNINVGNAISNANINIVGGDWLSRELNLNAGSGSINAELGQLSGVLNSISGAEHFMADTPTLYLGNNTINGDPTFASTGDIIINGVLVPTEALAVIAGGNITSTFGSAITPLGTFPVTLIAGADITSGGLPGTQTVSNASTTVGSV
ncbi:MAG: hypothetical protein K2X81_18635, partial [Candidatus Obscuribacterales bacterium]|nr:hypothetical protein [Candidatus Obscuribacterales bacterium]